jgi:hypothetical protein
MTHQNLSDTACGVLMSKLFFFFFLLPFVCVCVKKRWTKGISKLGFC